MSGFCSNGSLLEDVESMPTPMAAVVVRSGFKNYGKARILNDFNMFVPEHTIYGLLGASGCGKTTILSCIVAIRHLDSGHIQIFGWPSGSEGSGVPGRRVGYMPQEIALNGEFRMREVLQYFGRIYGMSQARIIERYEYLVQLLSLEKCSGRLARDLSDGQKRRVSLAVALLHEPELLILDEPTVGCDPLLRANIWKFLTELVAGRKTTVIVTTHYIEETRQAGRVGLMRGGRLLVEAAPEDLLRLHGTTLLDDIVHKLCLEDEEGESAPERQDDVSNVVPVSKEKESRSIGNCDTQNRTTLSNRLRALIIKNALVLQRNLLFLLFLLAMPIVTVIVFCYCVGSEPHDLHLGVVNHELDGTCMWHEGCENTNLSCLFLDSINKENVQLLPFETEVSALMAVRATRVWGYVSFGPKFSDYSFARLTFGKRNNATIQGSQIHVHMDMSNKGVGLTLRKLLYDAFREFNSRLLRSCEIDPASRDLPLTFEDPIYGEDDGEMVAFMAPGVSLGILFFMGALTCGLTYIIEKKDGMINRTRVAGVSTIEIMFSHFLVQLVVVFIQAILVLVVMLLVFRLPCEGSLILALTILLLMAVSGMSLGFLAATFCDEEKNAMLIAMGTVIPSYLLAGLIWPIESAPKPVQLFSFLLPGTLVGNALRSVMIRGFGIGHPVVWKGLLAGVTWSVVYWAVTVGWHRLRLRKG